MHIACYRRSIFLATALILFQRAKQHEVEWALAFFASRRQRYWARCFKCPLQAIMWGFVHRLYYFLVFSSFVRWSMGGNRRNVDGIRVCIPQPVNKLKLHFWWARFPEAMLKGRRHTKQKQNNAHNFVFGGRGLLEEPNRNVT